MGGRGKKEIYLYGGLIVHSTQTVYTCMTRSKTFNLINIQVEIHLLFTYPKCYAHMLRYIGPVAQWIRRLTTNQEIASSSPAGIITFCNYLLVYINYIVAQCPDRAQQTNR